jgi:type VI protein secretion system component VasF
MYKTPTQKATDEFFIRLRRLRFEARPDDVAHDELGEVLRRAKGPLARTRGGDDALYAMASLADERWRWAQNPFEHDFFGSDSRATEFYDRLDKLLAGSAKQRENADVVWVFLQSLTFGFRGQPPAGKTAAQYATKCGEFLQRGWGDFKDLAPRGEIPREAELESARRGGPIALLFAIGAFCLVLAGGLFALAFTHQTSVERAQEWERALK